MDNSSAFAKKMLIAYLIELAGVVVGVSLLFVAIGLAVGPLILIVGIFLATVPFLMAFRITLMPWYLQEGILVVVFVAFQFLTASLLSGVCSLIPSLSFACGPNYLVAQHFANFASFTLGFGVSWLFLRLPRLVRDYRDFKRQKKEPHQQAG